MGKRTRVGYAAVCAVLTVWAGGTAQAVDGTVAQSGAFSTSSTWVGGSIPGGPGSTVFIRGNFNVQSLYTNAVIGHILTPADATVSALTSEFYLSYPEGVRTDGNIDPVYGTYRFGVYTNYLTLDSGVEGQPATVQCLASALTSKYRYVINVPLFLKSDLAVRHAGRVSGAWDNPMTAIWLGKDIREEGGRRSVRAEFGKEDMQLMLMGSNTFSGDLIVDKGVVRAGSTERYGAPGFQFGCDNTVLATSGVATVDLGGNNFGPEKTIKIGGRGANGMGALVSGCQSPAVTSVWSGPVTLVSDACVAGTVGRYPRSEGGNLRIDGNITEGGSACSLENVSLRNLVLAGSNSYTKGTILTSGFLTALKAESLGSGPLIFNGGAFALDSATGVDPTDFTLVSTNSKPVQIILDGADYTPAQPFTGFKSGLTKGGPGALILKHNNSYTGTTTVARGDLILDYSETSGQKTEPEGTITLSGDARLIIRGGTSAITGQKSKTVATTAGSNARVINDSTMPFTFNFISPNSASTLNLEGDGPFLDVQTLNGSESTAYPNILPQTILFKAKDWAVRNANYSVSNFTGYVSTWEGSNKHVDVTAELAASVPEGISVSTLRFNTPNNGTPIVLNLSGTNFIKGGAILVTEAMGSTEVHITGGSIARMGTGSFIIYNYNTQAVVRIDSQLLGTPTILATNGVSGFIATNMIASQVAFVKAGPGKVILGDVDNHYDYHTYVVNGELEISGPRCLGIGSWHNSWKSIQNFVYVFNGATLTTKGTFTLQRETIQGVTNQIAFCANSVGGVINVANVGDTVTKEAINPSPVLYNGGRFIKRGKGAWCNKIAFGNSDDLVGGGVIARDQIMRFDVEEGTVALVNGASLAHTFIGEGPMVMTVMSNVVLKGAGWLFGNNGGANGGGSPEDAAGRKVLFIHETGATVDLNGTSVNMGAAGADTLARALDYLHGPGTLTVTNSSATVAAFSFNSLMNSGFTGRFDARIGMTSSGASSGGGLPNGELSVPEGVSHKFIECFYPHYPLRFGRLTGNGVFGGTGANGSDKDMVAFIGCDGGSTFEFGGHLWGTWYAANRGSFRYVKVGDNTWRISGTTNAMTANFTLRKGTVLVGANSPGNGAVGALGTNQVILGDSGTSQADTMALLTDGPYTVGNGIILTEYAPGAVAVLGGNQASGASLFTGALNLRRDVRLHSAGGDVTFSGAVTGPGGITKTGPGTVYLTGAVSNAGPTTVQAGQLVLPGGTAVTNTLTVAAGSAGSGTLAVNGNLTVGEGATLAVSTSGSLVRGQTYTLMTWTGARSGTFLTVTGLPADWHVGYLANSLILYYARPGTVIMLL